MNAVPNQQLKVDLVPNQMLNKNGCITKPNYKKGCFTKPKQLIFTIQTKIKTPNFITLLNITIS